MKWWEAWKAYFSQPNRRPWWDVEIALSDPTIEPKTAEEWKKVAWHYFRRNVELAHQLDTLRSQK